MPLTARQLEIRKLEEELGKTPSNFNLSSRQLEIRKLEEELKKEKSLGSSIIRPLTAIPEIFSEGLEEVQKPGVLSKIGGAATMIFSPALGPSRALGEGAEFLAEKAGFEEESVLSPKNIGTGTDILSSFLIPGSVFSAGRLFSKIGKLFSKIRIPKNLKDISKMEADLFRISGGKRNHIQRSTYIEDMEKILKKTEDVKFKQGQKFTFEETRLNGMELGMTAENMDKLLKKVPFNKIAKYLDAAKAVSVKTLTDFKGIMDKLPKNILTDTSDETLAIALNAITKVYMVTKTTSTFSSEVGRALRQSSRLNETEILKLFNLQAAIKRCTAGG